jgi:proteasome lid subunit RPN8/RPN11
MSADIRFRCWSAAGQRVECALPVLQQIGVAARDGFRRFRHGGMEIGGILIGSREGRSVRIVAAQPMTITYERGAVFLLTDAEHAALDALIDKTNKDVAPKELQVVGYYESRTRRDAFLSDTDVETYDAHFSKPSQVCIILKPDKENETIAAVYIRDERGEILAASLEGETAEEEGEVVPEQAPQPASVAKADDYIPSAMLPKRPARRWVYVSAIIAFLALASAAAIMWTPGTLPAPYIAIQGPAGPPSIPPVNANAAPGPSAKPIGKSKRVKRSRHRRVRSRKQER